MRCQCCEEQKATIQIRDTDEWAVKDVLLICDSCAQLVVPQFMTPTTALPSCADALTTAKHLLDKGPEAEAPVASANLPALLNVPDVSCENCGMTFREFQKVGRLGCAECYKAFNDLLEPVLERIHGAHPVQHTGRKPGQPATDSRASVRQQVQVLKRQMESAVNEENYERAAELRDEINELEARINE